MLGVARSCGVTTLARLAAVFGLGVGARAGVETTTAGHGAPMAPFGPVPVQHIAVVGQAAPAFGGAVGRQAERVHAAEITSVQAYIAIILAPGRRDCAMEIVGVRGVALGQFSVKSICNMALLRHGRLNLRHERVLSHICF